MDFIDLVKQFSVRAEKLKDNIQTEEATKTSLIMPFFSQVLGYDVFNPDEFIPEFTADVGIKKGEKVDYAVFLDDKPAILIEAKWCGEPLDKHDSQLFRYFGTTYAKFGILTNGLIYKFYTDLEAQNKMDLKPFLEIDILNLKESLVPELKRFTKNSFNVDEIFNSASELKYSNEIKTYFASQLKDPADDFIKCILSNIYDGIKTQSVVDKFKPLIKNSLNNYISELMTDRLTSVLRPGQEASNSVETTPQDEVSIEVSEELINKIATTNTELEAFYTIKAILAETVDISKITYKDTVNYFAILYDNNTTKWICRLKLDRIKNFLITPDENKKEIKNDIESVSDLFKYKNTLIEVVKRYI